MAYITVTTDAGDEVLRIGFDNTLTGEGGTPQDCDHMFDGSEISIELMPTRFIEDALRQARAADLQAEEKEAEHSTSTCCRQGGECDTNTP